MEVTVIGREGMSGAFVALDEDSSPHKTFMQVEGQGLRLATDVLENAMARSPDLHNVLLHYIGRAMRDMADSGVGRQIQRAGAAGTLAADVPRPPGG